MSMDPVDCWRFCSRTSSRTFRRADSRSGAFGCGGDLPAATDRCERTVGGGVSIVIGTVQTPEG
jgi:hypothetical protein